MEDFNILLAETRAKRLNCCKYGNVVANLAFTVDATECQQAFGNNYQGRSDSISTESLLNTVKSHNTAQDVI